MALGAVAAAAAGIYWYEGRGRVPTETSRDSAATAVRTVAATAGTAVDQLTAVGTLYARFKVDVSPPEAGHIEALPVPEGASVSQGDVLLVLESQSEMAALEDAKAQLRFENEKYERAKTLSGQGFAARAQLDETRAGVAAATSTVARNQIEVDHRSVKAAFAGRIGRYNYDIGSYVQPGDVVMTLRSTEVLYVDFHVPADVAGRLRTGAVFSASIDGVDAPVDGVVSFVDPEIDEATRSIELRGDIANAGGTLRPGMFARLTLTLAERPGALMIPKAALVYELAGRYVYVVRDGKAERVPVDVGAEVDDTVEIRSGLSVGDVLITDGRFRVRNGTAVRIVDDSASGEG
ncbi:MAG TPA: efflux RND transporter periplasmic adaptor subunit [Thalassobaculum sp.]